MGCTARAHTGAGNRHGALGSEADNRLTSGDHYISIGDLVVGAATAQRLDGGLTNGRERQLTTATDCNPVVCHWRSSSCGLL
jgi:hypothetical protein